VRLAAALAQHEINQDTLSQILRSLGQIARSVYQSIGGRLSKPQLRELTNATQAMLKLGLEFKNNPTMQTSGKRQELLNAVSLLVVQIKDIISVATEAVSSETSATTTTSTETNSATPATAPQESSSSSTTASGPSVNSGTLVKPQRLSTMDLYTLKQHLREQEESITEVPVSTFGEDSPATASDA